MDELDDTSIDCGMCGAMSDLGVDNFWDRPVIVYIHNQAGLPQGLSALLAILDDPIPYTLVGGLIQHPFLASGGRPQ